MTWRMSPILRAVMASRERVARSVLTAAEIQAISDVLNVAVPDEDDTDAMATWQVAADAVSKLQPALDDVDRAAGWKALDGFGCFVRVENGVLQQAPADVDGEICADEIIEVSAAERETQR